MSPLPGLVDTLIFQIPPDDSIIASVATLVSRQTPDRRPLKKLFNQQGN
jgi:hypothetical protein